jgi:hypothetical protein
MRVFTTFAAAATLALLASTADAKPCRTPQGKFIACPAQTAAVAQRCRGPNGAFVKCTAPGAKPVGGTVNASMKTSKPH